jgi:predicted HTH transcriptional regulator
MPSDDLESESLEFKGYKTEQAIHNARDLAEEISALANKVGGTIVIGVRSSTDVKYGDWPAQLAGVDHVDLLATQERITGKVQPKIGIMFRRVPFESKDYIVVEVPHRSDTLVSTSSGKTCIRDGRSSRPMSPHEIELAVKGLSTFDWSAEELDYEALSVIDQEALDDAIKDFRETRQLEVSPEPYAYLESIGATRNGRLTYGGLLFLGTAESIRDHLGDYEYRFSWKKKNADLLVNDVWSGCLWNAIKRARLHFTQCNRMATFETDGRKFEVPLMDSVAFHEGYLNALVHRDYSSDGMVTVTYTADRLVITSPGCFYGGVTAENITRHEPRHRNKALARMLMAHQLVDRAGMGVMRMGIRSLVYGRSFPEFREASDCVEVSMQAEFLRPGITVITLDHLDTWGIPELLVLNHVYEEGFVAAHFIEQQLEKFVDDPWDRLLEVIEKLEQVELCGTKERVFIRVTPSWKSLLKVDRLLPISPTSEKHVKLYSYLKRHREASNAELTEVLGYSYSSQTSKFLREAKYVQRSSSGPSARWSLVV